MDKDARRGRCYGDNEEKKLELRLGPPGQDWLENTEESEKDHFFNSVFPLIPFSHASKAMAAHFSAGTKRGYCDRIEPKTEAFQQEEQTNFRHLQAKQEIEKEISQRTNGRTDQQLSLEVKKCCLPLPKSTTASGSVAVAHNRAQIRSASTPVVGWPPIRSSRKNISSSSKQTVESEPGSSGTVPRKPETNRKNFFVKINMEGIPIGRKIDLLAYDCYEELSLAVDELFRDLLAAQMDPIDASKESVEKHAITGLLDGSGEYTLIYEDDEADRMLVGDVPWEMFVSTAKRLRVLKSSEVSSSSSSMGTLNWKKKPT